MSLLERTKLLFTAALVLLISIASPAAAQDCGFDSWDGDTSDHLDEDEFGSAISSVSYFDEWDGDGDGYLTEEEWDEGVDEYFDAYDYGDYGTYSDWDANADDAISDDEFGDGLFDLVDEDDTVSIEEEEWDVFDEEEDGLFC